MTIQIDDQLYSQLASLANQVNAQDSHCTASPYLFQIMTDVRLWDTGGNGDHFALFGNDGEEIGPFNRQTITEWCDNRDIPYPEWIESANEYNEFLHLDWVCENDLRVISYSIGTKLENGFLTEEACREHIRTNHYHYARPRPYVSHAFRNPELQLVFDFLKSISNDNPNTNPDRTA